MYIELLKEMFCEVTVKRNLLAISKYYHPDFMLYTNGVTMNYAVFLQSHQQYYSTPIQYKVEYDEETFFEKGEKVGGRMWILISRPNEPATKIEIILIAQFKEKKICRLWELTYPDWSQLPAFIVESA